MVEIVVVGGHKIYILKKVHKDLGYGKEHNPNNLS